MMSYKSEEQSLLLQEVSRQLIMLEDAIAKINSTRNQLKQRSLEVRSEIQTSVTRQLEALREREVYLLHQVDIVQQAKDAALHGQEEKLHQALGSLTTALQTAEAGQHAYSLTDTMDKLKNLNMNPNETPSLSFRANLAQASNAINNFGQIDTQGRPFDGLFDRQVSSASLPRTFEDYDDEEHHVLYKSLTDNDTSNVVNKHEISVTIPCLVQRPDDWLFMPTENPAHVKPAASPVHFQFPPFMSSNVQQFLGKQDGMTRSVSSAASIQQWLCDIQGQADLEEAEADFEVISPPASFVPASTKSSSIEVISMDETPPTFTTGVMGPTICSQVPSTVPAVAYSPTLPYFDQIRSEPVTDWLLVARGQDTQQSSSTYCHEILSYFHEVSNDTKHWLRQYSDKKQKDQCYNFCQKDVSHEENVCTSHVEKPVQMGIQNVTCDHTYKQEETSALQCWLSSGHGKDQAVIQPKMNDLYLPLSRCMSDDSGCRMMNEKSSSPTCGSDMGHFGVQEEVKGHGMATYFDAIVGQSTDSWLLYCDNDDGTLCEVTSEICENDVEIKIAATPVLYSASEFNPDCIFPPFSNPCKNTSWLTCDSLQTESRVPLYNFAYVSDVPNACESGSQSLSSVSASIDNNQDVEEKIKSLFSHNLPSSPTHKPTKLSYFDSNFQALDQQPLSDWLSPTKSYVPNIPPTKEESVHFEPFGKSTLKESWLSQSSLLLKQENSKELCKVEKSKCFDDNDGKYTNMASIFENFKNEHDDKNWLGSDNLLVD